MRHRGNIWKSAVVISTIFPNKPLSTISFAKLFSLKDILKDIDNLKKLQFLWLFMIFPPYISSSWILFQKWILIFKHICWRADDSLWLWLITAFGFLWKSIDNNIKVSKIKYIFCIFKKSGAVAVFAWFTWMFSIFFFSELFIWLMENFEYCLLLYRDNTLLFNRLILYLRYW